MLKREQETCSSSTHEQATEQLVPLPLPRAVRAMEMDDNYDDEFEQEDLQWE
ncbi:hypothetical protein ACEQ8H_005699 [Pleosporales sp. CAS-2024a]